VRQEGERFVFSCRKPIERCHGDRQGSTLFRYTEGKVVSRVVSRALCKPIFDPIRNRLLRVAEYSSIVMTSLARDSAWLRVV
jgi:hypothetical protein